MPLINAVIKSFGPKMTDGVHETYNGSNGLLYKFLMTVITDGKEETGEVNSNKVSPSWKLGPVYTMERVTRGQTGQFISYSKLNNTEAPATGGGSKPYGGGGGKKDTMAFAKQKLVEGAYMVATRFWQSVENHDPIHVITKAEHFDATAKVFAKWLLSFTDEQGMWYSLSALTIVSERDMVLPIQPVEGKKLVDVWIEEANKQRELFIAMVQ